MTKKSKLIIAGVLTSLATLGAYAYFQVKKILNYTLNFKGIRNVSFKDGNILFNIYYEYTNKADVDVTISEQEYDIFINNVFITTMRNYAPNVLKASQPSEIGIGVVLNGKELAQRTNQNYAQMIAAPANVKILILMKWKVKIGFLHIPIKYPYEMTLKDILSWYLPKK